jgi:hypothetical protein
LLRFSCELGDEQAIFADRIRDRRKISAVRFQRSVLLFGGGCAGFHAALLAPDTDSHHVAGIVFVHLIGKMERIVAVGAGKG